jgi:hypothetical protein
MAEPGQAAYGTLERVTAGQTVALITERNQLRCERDAARNERDLARAALEQASAIEAAARHLAETWSELLPDLPDSYSCEMNCPEAEAAAYLYRTLGDDATADAIIKAHAAYDEPGEMHSDNPVADAEEMTARLAELGPKPFKVGDRVLIIASDHPWHGHSGEISGPFETAKDPDLKWTVALDDGWSTGAVAERDIRRADR